MKRGRETEAKSGSVDVEIFQHVFVVEFLGCSESGDWYKLIFFKIWRNFSFDGFFFFFFFLVEEIA